jgi:AraC-like DNA-binding protein
MRISGSGFRPVERLRDYVGLQFCHPDRAASARVGHFPASFPGGGPAPASPVSSPLHKRPEPVLTSALRSLGVIATPAIELFDRLPDTLFWIKDGKSRFRWANMALVLLNGRTSRWDLLGATDSDFDELSRVNGFYHDDARALAGEAVVGRVELVVSNHVGRWFSTTKLPLRNARGRIVGTVGIAVPMPQKEAEACPGTPLARAMHFIGQHYRESLTNRKIAKAGGLSLRVFQRQFQEAYHCSPHAYIMQLRIRKSCQALALSERALADVAKEYCFSSQSHFSRVFRHIMGMTPSEYRLRYRR